MWPEAVRDVHVAELQQFVAPGVHLDVESVAAVSDYENEHGITLGLVEKIACDPNIGRAAQRLVARGAAAVAYGCTSGSYVLGSEGDAAIVEQLHDAGRTPATTTSTAVVVALRELAIHRVAVLSPHVEALNDRLRAYLASAGITVVNVVGLNLLGDIELIDPAETSRIVETRVMVPTAEAVFVSCTGMRTAAVIEHLERATAVPIITANQATIWHVARLAGMPYRRPGRGRLLA